MAEYSRLAKGHFSSTGFAKVINLPFVPDRVEFTNYTLANTNATSQNIISAKWDVFIWVKELLLSWYEGYNATPALIYDVVSVNGISSLFPSRFSFAIWTNCMRTYWCFWRYLLKTAAGAPAVVTTTAAHGLAYCW